jgi:histidinol-phosphatase (PHP family)
MANILDYHTHSEFSVDAEGSLVDLVAVARDSGIAQIAITEHVDFVDGDSSTGFFRPAEYLCAINAARRAVGAGIDVIAGMELGIEPLAIVRSLAVADEPFYGSLDFVIGSVHQVAGMFPEDHYFDSRDRRAAYADYFADVQKAVESIRGSHLVDVIGHIDIVKRHAPDSYRHGWLNEVREELLVLLKTIIDEGIGIEINVSGLRQAPKEQFPSLDVLRLYRELGGEILTIGSDSHTAGTLRNSVPHIVIAQELARTAGFRYLTQFSAREASFIPIS